jgi:hypothetical protein
VSLPAAIEVPAGLPEVLGAEPVETYRTQPLGDLSVVLPDEAAVRSAAPDLIALAKPEAGVIRVQLAGHGFCVVDGVGDPGSHVPDSVEQDGTPALRITRHHTRWFADLDWENPC